MASNSKSSVKPVAAAVFAATQPAQLDSYVLGDALPIPEVIEKNSDSVWELWSNAVKKSPDPVADTQPATLAMGLPKAPNKNR